MSKPVCEPIKVKSTLAPNPKNAPKFAVQCQLADGESIQLADPVSTRAMVACMDMNAVIGGAASHFGGPAAFAELMSVAYGYAFFAGQKENRDWFELFNIINDAGHCENGLYALKANYGYAGLNLKSLRGFRSIESALTGHGESHLFPEGVQMSNGPLGSAFPQSQGLALADHLAGRDRITVVAISDGASMEGEAKEAFTAVPGLAKKGQLAPFICMLSDNNTKLTGRIDEEAFSMQPYFDSLEKCGWKVIELENGNDLAACLQAFETAVKSVRGDSRQPVLIRAHTVKGIGTKKTAESSSGGHGFPLKTAADLPQFVSEIYGDGEVPKEIKNWVDDTVALENKKIPSSIKPTVAHEKIQVGISKAMIEKRQQGLPVISISSDLPGSTGVAGFQKEMANCAFDMGVAESNMVSVGAGLSKLGYIPVVDTFAQFGVTKGGLPLTMASLSQSPIIAVFSHTGFQDAADGASHQSLTYFAMVSSIPDVEVYALTSSQEAHALMGQALDRFSEQRAHGQVPKSVVFFLGRENFARYYNETQKHKLGQAEILFDSAADFENSVTIAGVGSMLPQALTAAEVLKTQGMGAVVVNPSAINHPDTSTFRLALSKTEGRLITVEEHQKIGGFGARLSQALLEEGLAFFAKNLAVEGQFGQSAYKAQHLYEKHGLDAAAIVNAALEMKAD